MHLSWIFCFITSWWYAKLFLAIVSDIVYVSFLEFLVISRFTYCLSRISPLFCNISLSIYSYYSTTAYSNLVYFLVSTLFKKT